MANERLSNPRGIKKMRQNLGSLRSPCIGSKFEIRILAVYCHAGDFPKNSRSNVGCQDFKFYL